MAEYKQKRIIDGKSRYVILNGRGIVIDKNLSKDISHHSMKIEDYSVLCET